MVRPSTINVGDERELVIVRDLTRTRLVQYAGVSGDFNPVHTDEVFARNAVGAPSVFGHGMLTMGMTGRVVTDWVGPDRLLSFRARFVKQVWPGDDLTARATVVAVEEEGGEPRVRFSLTTTNGRGETVLLGEATARFGPRHLGHARARVERVP